LRKGYLGVAEDELEVLLKTYQSLEDAVVHGKRLQPVYVEVSDEIPKICQELNVLQDFLGHHSGQ
jgi:hypothetical protein